MVPFIAALETWPSSTLAGSHPALQTSTVVESDGSALDEDEADKDDSVWEGLPLPSTPCTPQQQPMRQANVVTVGGTYIDRGVDTQALPAQTQ